MDRDKPTHVREIGDGSADLAVEFETGNTLRVYGLDENDKLVVRPGTEFKREKSIYGPDLVTVYITGHGRREIVDWPFSDRNTREGSEGFWSWMQRIICHPEVEGEPLDLEPDEEETG